jgi:REP element-mobilizing transposase RayT
MNTCESLNHMKWECKYPVVFIPKYRSKVLFGKLRPHPGKVFRELARQKESEIEEGHLMDDQMHKAQAGWSMPARSSIGPGRCLAHSGRVTALWT